MLRKTILFVLAVNFIGCQSEKASCEQQRNKLDSYRTKHRVNAYPNKHQLTINPPSFLWPATDADKKKASFNVLLVKKGTTDTLKSGNLRWASWKPENKLTPGNYTWTLQKEIDQKVVSQENYSFEVPEGLTTYTPPIVTAAQVNAFYGAHPRFFQLNAKGKEIAERLPKSLQNTILKNANTFLAKETVNGNTVFNKIPKELNEIETKRVKINISKKVINHLRLKTLYLAQAYALTGAKKYARAALEKFEVFESLPDELKQLNDFTRGMSLDLGLYMFDGFYHELTAKQRQYIIDFCYPIIHHEYEHSRMRLETHEFDNHVWQKGIALITRASLILGKHVPEATEWMLYVGSVWATRAPAGGFNYDGAWINGNSYMTANIITLIQTPMILNKITGFDYLSHPWYQNLTKAMIATYQGKSYSNGFGDGHDSKTMPVWIRGQLAQYIARETQNPFATWYAEQIAQSDRGIAPTEYDPLAKHPLDSEGHQWLINTLENPLPKSKTPDYNRLAVFENAGFASIHNNLLDSKNNMHVAFRSSVYGGGSHTMSNANAFNILLGGKPLFLSSGYYTNFSDKHNLLHYRNTRGHNTILVNGVGQSIGRHAYGEIEASLETPRIAYVRGDASNAYRGELRDPMWQRNFKNSGVEFTAENGFGKTTLEKYKRHLIVLDKRTVIIYDELAAAEPVQFNWLLHSPLFMQKLNNNYLEVADKANKATILLTGSTAIKSKVSNEFNFPAENWSGKKIKGKLVSYDKQWHLNARSEKTDKMFYLGILQVDGAGISAEGAQKISESEYLVGQWKISANLNKNKKASLTIYNNQTEEFFHLGDTTFEINGKQTTVEHCSAFYRTNKGDKLEMQYTNHPNN